MLIMLSKFIIEIDCIYNLNHRYVLSLIFEFNGVSFIDLHRWKTDLYRVLPSFS